MKSPWHSLSLTAQLVVFGKGVGEGRGREKRESHTLDPANRLETKSTGPQAGPSPGDLTKGREV